MSEKPPEKPKLLEERKRVYAALIKVRDGNIAIITPQKGMFNASIDIDMTQLAQDLSALQERFPKKLWLNVPLHRDDKEMTLLKLYREIAKRAEEDRQTYLQESKAARTARQDILAQNKEKNVEDPRPYKQDPMQKERFHARVATSQLMKTIITIDLEQSGLIKPTLVQSDVKMHGKAMDVVDEQLASGDTAKVRLSKPIKPEDVMSKSWVQHTPKRNVTQERDAGDDNDSKVR